MRHEKKFIDTSIVDFECICRINDNFSSSFMNNLYIFLTIVNIICCCLFLIATKLYFFYCVDRYLSFEYIIWRTNFWVWKYELKYKTVLNSSMCWQSHLFRVFTALCIDNRFKCTFRCIFKLYLSNNSKKNDSFLGNVFELLKAIDKAVFNVLGSSIEMDWIFLLTVFDEQSTILFGNWGKPHLFLSSTVDDKKENSGKRWRYLKRVTWSFVDCGSWVYYNCPISSRFVLFLRLCRIQQVIHRRDPQLKTANPGITQLVSMMYFCRSRYGNPKTSIHFTFSGKG